MLRHATAVFTADKSLALVLGQHENFQFLPVPIVQQVLDSTHHFVINLKFTLYTTDT